ncbi:hypothetical protein D3H34_15510 [Acidovorax cavernicola]|uniref:Uncharacterized protein n=2 Tax=Betaproteobacteria TaxID=28216 RepID=A0A9X8D403_9BURK|nr:hypothetical protein D3H34_15510 [Acidovorax cavernicola]
MFVTMDSHEVRISSMLAGPGVRCWRAVKLNLSIPFFFPTWVVQEDDLEVPERALLIYESDFLDLFESVGPQSLRHLQYLAPMESDRDRWQIRDIRKIWSATSGDADQVEHLVLEDESGAQFTHYYMGTSFSIRHQIWPVN